MKKLLKNEILKVKLEIKNRYLAGESVPSIAESFDVVPRTIYFHLGNLSPEGKGLHAKNSSLRKMAVKKKKGLEAKHVKAKKQKADKKGKKVKAFIRQRAAEKSSLVDFIES